MLRRLDVRIDYYSAQSLGEVQAVAAAARSEALCIRICIRTQTLLPQSTVERQVRVGAEIDFSRRVGCFQRDELTRQISSVERGTPQAG